MSEIVHHPSSEAKETSELSDLSSVDLSFRVYNQLIPLTAKHTGSGARFARLPFRPRDKEEGRGYPGQLLDDFHLHALEGPGFEDIIMTQAEQFFPGFSVVVEAFNNQPELLDEVYEKVFVDKENVAVVTEHSEIYDIALVTGAMRVSLFQRATEREVPLVPASSYNVIVSQIIAQLGIQSIANPAPQPALNVLTLGADVHLSFPGTASMSRARIPSNLKRQRNAAMLHNLGNKLDAGGQLVFFAPSGSRDENLCDRLGEKLHVMQPPSRGTFEKLMQHQATHVLGVSIALDAETGPVVTFSDIVKCATDEDCHEVLDSIASMRTENTGVKTVYARTREELMELKDAAQEVAQNMAHNKTFQKRSALGLGIGSAALGALEFYRRRRKRNK